VIITDQWFHHSGKHYTRGDTVDIEPEYFDGSRMTKIVEEPKASIPVMLTAKVEPIISSELINNFETPETQTADALPDEPKPKKKIETVHEY